jgi:carbon-monoxide dehydrogenase medium subunit
VKPAPFDLHRPTTLDEAVAAVAEHGDEGKVLAGGQSLVPLLALRLVTPEHLVDLGDVHELRTITLTEGHLAVGAMATHDEVGRDPLVRRHAPLLARSVPFVGHSAIRNRGTCGGSIAHADPAAEYPAVCLALRASFEVVGPGGTRIVPTDDFFVSTFTTVLEPDEVLRSVRLPLAQDGSATGSAVDEVAQRHGDFALAGAAVSVAVGSDRRITRAGIALFGVADRPWPCSAAEAALTGADVAANLDAVAEVAVAELDPVDSLHATGRYRKQAAKVLVRRCLRRALEEAARG